MNAHLVCWYALATRPRHEKTVAVQLRAKGLPQLLPLYRERHRWSDRHQAVDLPLFPGYVFARFGGEQYGSVLRTAGVRAVVGFGGRPAPVAEAEIAALETIIHSGRPAVPWLFLRQGQRVRIDAGPLAGLEGILLRQRDNLRVVVSVELLQRAVAVEIDRDAVAALDHVTGGPLAPVYVDV